MSHDVVERRLAAILAADVAGYSRLMGEDEVRTVAALRAHRKELIDPKLAEHRGRLVNTAGDSVLAEFPSVLDAVRCAVEIQQAMDASNLVVPQTQRIVLRIGINVGDVIFQEGEVYGDGVNIAARLEQIAEPGSVYVSSSVREQVGERLPYHFEPLGMREVKNIAHPVDVSRVRWDVGFVPAKGASRASAPGPRDPRPSLAVLPFTNMSGDPGQDYFADGLTEDLITDISRFSRMAVVARNTVFTYKGRAVDVIQVGKELGVHHVLEGSVRKSGDRVRLNAQLIDARTGRHMWAQRFDRELKDLFDLQDEMTRAIVSELEVRILEGEQAHSWQRGTKSPLALDLFRRSRAAHVPMTLPGFLEALDHLRRAVEVDPAYARAWAGIAGAGTGALMYGLATGQQELLAECRKAADEALALDPNLAEGWIARGHCLLFDRERDAADESARRGHSLGANANIVVTGVARICLFIGQVEKAIELALAVASRKRTVSRHPAVVVGLGSLVLGRYADALPMSQAQIGFMPDSIMPRLILAAGYAGLGRVTEAQEQGKEVKRLLAGESFAALACWMLPFVDPEPRDRIVALMRKAEVD